MRAVDKSGAGASLRENEIVIWKPIEDALDVAMEELRNGKAGKTDAS
jgi:hypothetical protein